MKLKYIMAVLVPFEILVLLLLEKLNFNPVIHWIPYKINYFIQLKFLIGKYFSIHFYASCSHFNFVL